MAASSSVSSAACGSAGLSLAATRDPSPSAVPSPKSAVLPTARWYRPMALTSASGLASGSGSLASRARMARVRVGLQPSPAVGSAKAAQAAPTALARRSTAAMPSVSALSHCSALFASSADGCGASAATAKRPSLAAATARSCSASPLPDWARRPTMMTKAASASTASAATAIIPPLNGILPR